MRPAADPKAFLWERFCSAQEAFFLPGKPSKDSKYNAACIFSVF